METKNLIWLVVIAFIGVALVWVIFGEHPGEPEASIPDEIQYPAGVPYSNKIMGFQVTVPTGFIIDDMYTYEAFGPEKEIPGIAFRIPASHAAGTNLSRDSYVSVEKLSNVECVPKDFLSDPMQITPSTLGGNSVTRAQSSGAAAGNLYEETIFVRKNAADCFGVRYFIHTTNIGNYESGTVKLYDKDALLATFERIASSLIIN